MPSLFSRTRTTSTPTKNKPLLTASTSFDEFGRVLSRERPVTPSGSVKKDKSTKRKESKQNGPNVDDLPAAIPDGSFLGLNLDPLPTDDGQERPKEHDYGYLSYKRDVILGLEQVSQLVDVLAHELGARGLTTPFIFSSLALDVSAPAIRRLITAFLRVCENPTAETEEKWREEARFAAPPELAMGIRWGLARIVRVYGGQEVRGLLDYQEYVHWRDDEAELEYPPAHFAAFLPQLAPLVRAILITVFTLLARLTAHSASSGHTPPTLSPLFAPLLFGLGPATLAFHHAYVHYLRAVHATEHLLLAFVRWQDSPATDRSVGPVPPRLKDWIRGYPSTLPSASKPGANERPQPRRGARTVRVVSVRRNVRMYSPDLVKTGASWAHRPRGGTKPGNEGLMGSKEWERIVPPTLKLPPRYSDNYRKRMDLPGNFQPDTGSGAGTLSTAPSAASSLSSSTASTLIDNNDYFGSPASASEGEFKSLSDQKWGEFETIGFGGLYNEKKLQFDLTEGARAARSAKRSTLSWDDFSSAGFSRNDDPLTSTLQFSAPVANSISSWPSQQAELHRKLKKTQRSLPAFGWDTEPVMGTEEWIEEAFMDVFCDLVYGGGWMDIERSEEVDRECNWALVEFKSLPINRTTISGGGADPRTSTTLMLFEEFVPAEYRQQLAAATGQTRRRLPSLFGKGNKSWKQATTLNGRPYVVGHVPASPSVREVDFDSLLKGRNASVTKVMTLEKGGIRTVTPLPGSTPASGPATPRPAAPPAATTPLKLPTAGDRPESPMTPAKGNRLSGLPPMEATSVDFETRMASMSDDERSPGGTKGRRESMDDAWVDILVATNNRRMAGQDAAPPVRRRGLGVGKGGRSDPELASQEVAAALAAVKHHPFPDDEDMEPVHGMHAAESTADGQSMLDREDMRGSMYTENTVDEDSLTDREPSNVEPTAPEPRDSVSIDDSDEDGNASAALAALRRRAAAGYFAQHPDRRPPSINEDPRARFEKDDADDESPYGGLEDNPVARTTPTRTVRPLPVPGASPPPPPPAPVEETPSPNGKELLAGGAAASAVTIGKKTSALIEMYRQREAQGSPSPSSRVPVPVRAPIPSKDNLAPSKDALVPPTGPSRSPNSSPSRAPAPAPAAPSPSPSPTIRPPLPPVPVVPGADVPRYVHGAPLHNLVEEEEEE